MRNGTRAAVLAVLAAGGVGVAQPVVVGFEGGPEGWEGPQGIGGATQIQLVGGNPGARLRTIFNNFGITFYTDTNEAFLGDYGARFSSVTLRFDIKVDQVEFFGQQVSRPLILDLRTPPPAGSPYPWVSTYFAFEPISSVTDVGWQTRSVTISDTTLAVLPAGWRGYGDEDPVTFEPRLPPGVTFADVLSNVTTVAISTLEPGFFFGFTDFDVSLDNITIDGTARGGGCGLGDVGGAGGAPGGDGVLDNNDFVVFIDWFFGSDARADVGRAGGEPGTDGLFDNNDFIVFIDRFFAGCGG